MPSKMIKLMYFARLKESLGLSHEMITIPSEIKDVAKLIHWLSSRGALWEKEFGGTRIIRAAINLNLVANTAEINDGDEIALFPPVTGG
jgi:molybdopterin synthase sulfur carrier subunit